MVIDHLYSYYTISLKLAKLVRLLCIFLEFRDLLQLFPNINLEGKTMMW